MSQRFFRAPLAVYEQLCAALDAAYGYPTADGLTLRSLPLASDLPNDETGRVYLAVSREYCGYELPSQMIPQLIAAGAVEEIDGEAFRAAWAAYRQAHSDLPGTVVDGQPIQWPAMPGGA